MFDMYPWWLKWDIDEIFSMLIHWVIPSLRQFQMNARNTISNIMFLVLLLPRVDRINKALGA